MASYVLLLSFAGRQGSGSEVTRRRMPLGVPVCAVGAKFVWDVFQLLQLRLI